MIFTFVTRRTGTAAAGALLTACATGAFAQDGGDADRDAPVETITVTGLRPVALDAVTASVSVLDADALAIRNAPYLADELRAVPGVAVSRSGARGGLTQIRVRGAEANHTLVLLDGIEVSDPITGETDFGLWAGLDVARVEVARGEQSAIYGSDAIGGVVSIISNTAPGFGLAAEGGTRGSWRASGCAGAAFDWGYLAVDAAGFATPGVDTAGLGGEDDGSQAYAGGLRGGVQLSDEWTLSGLFRYSVNEVETDPDLNSDGVLDDADRESDSAQWLAGAALTGSVFGFDHALRASFGRVDRENVADGTFTDETIGERFRAAYSPSIAVDAGGGDLVVTGVVDVEREDYERTGLTDLAPGGLVQEADFTTVGVGGEARYTLNGLTLNGSVRRDDNDDQFGDAVTWRLGAAYALPTTTRVRASIGRGVKNPTFTELFGFFPDAFGFIGNPDLDPERSTSVEVGFDQRVGPLEGSVTLFRAELEDEIVTVFNPDFTSSPANLDGDSVRRGVEAAASWAVTPGLSARGHVTYIESENDQDEDEIRVPGVTASLALDWRSVSKNGLRAGLALDYVGEQDDLFFGSFPSTRVTLDDYVLLSLTGEYPVTDRAALTFRGENVLDQDIEDVLGFNQPGVEVLFGVRVR